MSKPGTMKSDLKSQKRWVLWSAEKSGARVTKIPYSITGKKASSTDQTTWATYKQAKDALNNFGSGIGVIFTPDETLLGIDIDHVLEDGKLSGEHTKAITDLIKKADTFTEVSPSGTGLHLYLQLTAPLTLKANRRPPFEAYTSGRFFTFTEQSFSKNPRPIRIVTPEEAVALLAIIGFPWQKADAPAAIAEARETLFTDEEVLKRMFASKNGDAIKAVYEGDASAFNKDFSRADASLLSHLAFWCRKDAAQMERIWMASPLGQRKKTKERKDYRDRTIAGSIKNCKDIFRTQEERIKEETGIDFLYTMDRQKNKIVTQNTENISRVLRQHPDFMSGFRYDSFTNVFEVLDQGQQEWRAFEDNDAVRIQTAISIKFDFFQKVGKDMVFDAVMLVCKENTFDSAVEYVTSLEWDKQPRLDTWLTSVYGVEDSEYHRAVASNWMKGLVKRIVQPGCKFDYVLVLEGEQGVKKSTSLHVLGYMTDKRNWHVETTMSTDNKDFFMQFAGKVIIEFSEGETLSRTEVKKMKAIITMQSDKYRLPYGRVSLDFPRRCVFAMTTNQDEYLKDETGNRRWLPVRVVKDEADIEWLQANRDQLLAEAYHRVVTLKESVYEFPKEETLRQQEARRISDPNTDRIVEWYTNDPFLTEGVKESGITPQMVYQHALSGFGSLKKYEEMSITTVLRDVLKLKRVRRQVGGTQAWRWVQEEPQPSVLSIEVASLTDPDLPEGF